MTWLTPTTNGSGIPTGKKASDGLRPPAHCAGGRQLRAGPLLRVGARVARGWRSRLRPGRRPRAGQQEEGCGLDRHLGLGTSASFGTSTKKSGHRRGFAPTPRRGRLEARSCPRVVHTCCAAAPDRGDAPCIPAVGPGCGQRVGSVLDVATLGVESRFKGFGENGRGCIKASWRRQAAWRLGLIAAAGGTRVGSECSALLRSRDRTVPLRRSGHGESSERKQLQSLQVRRQQSVSIHGS